MRVLSLFLVLFILNSCTTEYIILEPIESLSLLANGNSKVINQTVQFRLIKNNGEDVTELSTFFVNNQPLEDNTFTSTSIGKYVVRAQYKEFESDNQLEIIYHDGTEIFFKSNIVVEDYTGTWCGNCPRVTDALNLAADQLGDNKDQLIKVAIHRLSSNPSDSGYDPFNFDSSSFEPNGGYPKAFINRLQRWTPLEHNNMGMVINPTQTVKKLGFKMQSEKLPNNQIKLVVNGLFSENFSNVKLVVYVLEDGLVYNQVNYTSFFGGANPLVNYVHDYTLRRILTSPHGEPINNSQLGSEFVREYIFSGTDNISNINKTKFVAMFLDGDGRVMNARQCSIEENQEEYQFE